MLNYIAMLLIFLLIEKDIQLFLRKIDETAKKQLRIMWTIKILYFNNST